MGKQEILIQDKQSTAETWKGKLVKGRQPTESVWVYAHMHISDDI